MNFVKALILIFKMEIIPGIFANNYKWITILDQSFLEAWEEFNT